MSANPTNIERQEKKPLVEIRGLHVAMGRQKVLRDINLTVRRGETLAIIGESGCGKTVLMKAIIGMIRPSQGSVIFDGKNLAEMKEKDLTLQRIRFGFVFQGSALFDSMTIEENVAFPLRQHSHKKESEIRKIVLERLADVGLSENILHKKPAELSGGMRKRVGLARALALGPEIILYDEPTTGLDPIMSDVINELIISTRSHFPVTSIVVTHDMHTARRVAERMVMLYPLSRLKPQESQIIFDGSPREAEESDDPRVKQFVRGEAGERLTEMRENNHASPDDENEDDEEYERDGRDEAQERV